MSQFKIKGGKSLNGQIKISGSKNASLPILSACLLTEEECEVSNVPEILDISNFLEIIKSLGVKVKRENNLVKIKADQLDFGNIRLDLIGKLRGSILLFGSLLPRVGEFRLPLPGGDVIGARPIDSHLKVFKRMGAEIKKGNYNLKIKNFSLSGSKIILPEVSVTATENALLSSVLAKGETIIKLAAVEPHIGDLIDFLNKMGAKIEGKNTHTLRVRGVKKLKGVKHRVIPDSDEAVSLIVLAGATSSSILLKDLELNFIEAALDKLEEIGLNLKVGKREVFVDRPKRKYKSVKLQTGLYPKLSSDQIPPMSVLLTQAKGESLIHEWMYENRLSYLKELKKMGAKIKILDPHRALVFGPSKLKGGKIKSLDIRAGITLLIAALAAEGESILNNIEQIDRGYQNIEDRLKKVGAEIERKS